MVTIIAGMDAPIRILHVDDDASLRETVKAFLETSEGEITVHDTASAQEGLSALTENEYSCVISDFDMPECDGLTFLEMVRDTYQDLPFILFTGKGSEEVASDAISKGVTDYLQKQPGVEQFELLTNRVMNAIERYDTQQEIIETRRLYRSILDDPNILAGLLDTTGKLLDVNDTALEYTSVPREDVLGNFLWETPWFDDVENGEIKADVERAGNGEYVSFTLSIDHPLDDNPVHLDGSIRPITDESGSVRSMVISSRDVTDQKESAQEVQRTRARYERILEHLSDYILIVDGMGEISFVSPGVERVVGFRPDEVLGENAFQFIHPEDQEIAAEAFAKTLDNPAEDVNVEYRAQHADGSWQWIEVRGGNYLDDPLIEGIVVTVRDIAKRKKREQEVAHIRERYQAFTEHSLDVLTVIDEQGVIQYESPSVSRVLGYDPPEITGENAFEYIHPDDRDEVFEGFVETISSEDITSNRFVYRFKHADGSWVWLESTGSGTYDETSGGYVVSSRDVSDRVQYRERLQLLQKRTQALMHTSSREETARIATEAATEDLGAQIAGCHVLNEAGDMLKPLAFVDTTSQFAETPSYPRDGSNDRPAITNHIWNIFEEGEAFYHESVHDTPELLEETPAASAMVFPLDDIGLFIVSSTEEHAFDEQDFALMEILSTSLLEAFYRVDREARLVEVAQSTNSLFAAETKVEAAELGVSVAEEILGLTANSIHFYDAPRNILVPVAATDELIDLIGDPPIFKAGESIAWNVFTDGEATIIDDVSKNPEVLNTDTPMRSEIMIPLGDHGILIGGSTEVKAFGSEEIALGELLEGTLSIVLDRIEHEEELRRREREVLRQNERLEGLAAVVSHDLRSPLNVASGNLSLARDECSSEYLDRIESSHKRMNELIEELLAIAQSRSPITETETVPLPGTVQSCWENVDTEDATLETTVSGSIEADSSRLKQLFENLIRNAIEHAGTDVSLTIGDLDDGFYVEDDGPGIPQDERSDVFTSGYSTTDTGTGFGLAIVRDIAEAHDWSVTLTESDAGGTRFEFRSVEIVR